MVVAPSRCAGEVKAGGIEKGKRRRLDSIQDELGIKGFGLMPREATAMV